MIIIGACIVIIGLAINTFNELKALIREKQPQKTCLSRKANGSAFTNKSVYICNRENTLFRERPAIPKIIDFESIKRGQVELAYENKRHPEFTYASIEKNIAK